MKAQGFGVIGSGGGGDFAGFIGAGPPPPEPAAPGVPGMQFPPSVSHPLGCCPVEPPPPPELTLGTQMAAPQPLLLVPPPPPPALIHLTKQSHQLGVMPNGSAYRIGLFLLLQGLQTLGLRHVHPAVFGLPGVECHLYILSSKLGILCIASQDFQLNSGLPRTTTYCDLGIPVSPWRIINSQYQLGR